MAQALWPLVLSQGLVSVTVFLQGKACLWAEGEPAYERLPPQPTSGPALAQANACQALSLSSEGHPPVLTLLRTSPSTVWRNLMSSLSSWPLALEQS